MKKIQTLVNYLNDEIEGAREYAIEYLQRKSDNDPNAGKFKTLADTEINHANVIHEIAVAEINNLKKIYTAPAEMQDEWDREHRKYVEDVAVIKQYLTM